jgi:hypothetical protein
MPGCCRMPITAGHELTLTDLWNPTASATSVEIGRVRRLHRVPNGMPPPPPPDMRLLVAQLGQVVLEEVPGRLVGALAAAGEDLGAARLSGSRPRSSPAGTRCSRAARSSSPAAARHRERRVRRLRQRADLERDGLHRRHRTHAPELGTGTRTVSEEKPCVLPRVPASPGRSSAPPPNQWPPLAGLGVT